MIPQQLQELKQWIPCHLPPENPKRPLGGPTTPNTYTFTELQSLLKPNQLFGIGVKEDDTYLVIDVDNLPPNPQPEDIHPELLTLLQKYPTYVEYSPSKRGLHITYKTDKTDSLFRQRPAQDKSLVFKGSLFIRDQFVTFTGDLYVPLCSTPPSIALIDPHMLQGLMVLSNIIPMPKQYTTPVRPQDAPKFEDLKNLLWKIPATLSTSPHRDRFLRVYQNFNPPLTQVDDYEHWRICAAALHYGCWLGGNVEKGAELFDEWSAADQDHYDGTARQKYFDNSPDKSARPITHDTLFALAKALRPVWPYSKIVKGEVHPDWPNPVMIDNFLALVKHYNLELQENEITKELRITGNEYLTNKFGSKMATKESVDQFVARICQYEFYHERIHALVPFAKVWYETRAKYNPIKRWIDSAPTWNPKTDISYFDKLFDTLTFPANKQQYKDLYYIYLKKALSGIIRAHYYTGQFSATTGIVILQGPENTYKSTWITQLLPQQFKRYILRSQESLSRNTNIKEIQIQAATCQIWLRDEVEQLFSDGKTNQDAALKNLLVQDMDYYRPVYGTGIIMVPRRCIFFGTTNLPNLRISDEGSRRIQIIPVTYCDTKAMQEIPMEMVYRELLYEFQQLPVKDQHEAWALTTDEIAITNDVNTTEFKTDQELDLVLKEFYRFNELFDLQNFKTRTSLHQKKLKTNKTIVQELSHNGVKNISFGALKHSLKRICGKWTDTHKTPLVGRNWVVEHGQGKIKKADGTDSVSGWLMPELKTDFVEEEHLD